MYDHNGVNVNVVFEVIEHDNYKIIKLLLEYGLNINEYDDLKNVLGRITKRHNTINEKIIVKKFKFLLEIGFVFDLDLIKKDQLLDNKYIKIIEDFHSNIKKAKGSY